MTGKSWKASQQHLPLTVGHGIAFFLERVLSQAGLLAAFLRHFAVADLAGRLVRGQALPGDGDAFGQMQSPGWKATVLWLPHAATAGSSSSASLWPSHSWKVSTPFQDIARSIILCLNSESRD